MPWAKRLGGPATGRSAQPEARRDDPGHELAQRAEGRAGQHPGHEAVGDDDGRPAQVEGDGQHAHQDDAGRHQAGRDLVDRVGEREEGARPAGRARCGAVDAHDLLLPEPLNPDQISRVSRGDEPAAGPQWRRVQASGSGTGWGGGGPT